jgi:hypothetical protein
MISVSIFNAVGVKIHHSYKTEEEQQIKWKDSGCAPCVEDPEIVSSTHVLYEDTAYEKPGQDKEQIHAAPEKPGHKS